VGQAAGRSFLARGDEALTLGCCQLRQTERRHSWQVKDWCATGLTAGNYSGRTRFNIGRGPPNCNRTSHSS